MSATPIPRTLALMIYGDLDVSVIDELPPGRRSIETYAVPSSYHERIYAFLEKQLAEGRQAYIVCPMVEENGELPDERKAVTAYAEKIAERGASEPNGAFSAWKNESEGKGNGHARVRRGRDRRARFHHGGGGRRGRAERLGHAHRERGVLRALAAPSAARARGARAMAVVLHPRFRQPREDNKTRLDAMRRTQSGFALAEEDLSARPGRLLRRAAARFADAARGGLRLRHGAALRGQGAAEALLALDPRLEGHLALHARVRELFDLNAEALN